MNISDKGRKVFVLGDSVSLHYGPYLEELSKGVFVYTRKTGEEPWWKQKDTSGMEDNGGSSRLVLSYLRAMKGNVEIDILLVNAGLHDIRRKTGEDNQLPVSIKEYKTNLEEIIKTGKEIAKDVVWVTTTDFDEKRHNKNLKFNRFKKDSEDYHQAALYIMQKNNISIIPLREFTKRLGENIFEDHVHFVDGIRKKQAEFIADWLNNFFGGKSF